MGQSLRGRADARRWDLHIHHSAHASPRTKTISMSMIPAKKSIFSAPFRMPPPPPPPPPPVPQAKKGLGKLTMSANKKTLLFNSKVIKRLEPKTVKIFKPSRKSVAEEAEFLKIVKTIHDTYAALPGKSGVETYFMNMLGKALEERRDLQNLLLALKTALRAGGRARDSQLVQWPRSIERWPRSTFLIGSTNSSGTVGRGLPRQTVGRSEEEGENVIARQ